MDLPKRRLVTYVSEETYARLDEIAKKENRSISSIAEIKITSALEGLPARNVPAQPSTDRHEQKTEDIKNSVLDVITNLPDENLQILAVKLSGILARHGPARISTAKTTPVKEIPDRTKVIELAARLQKFISSNNISQRAFKEKYGVDITHIARWQNGSKGMSEEKILKFESILSSAI